MGDVSFGPEADLKCLQKQKAASVGGLDPRTEIQIRCYNGSITTVAGMFLLATVCISLMFIKSAETFLSAEYDPTCTAPKKRTPTIARNQTTLRIGMLSKISHLKLKVTDKN